MTLTKFLLSRIAEDEAEARLIPDPFTEHWGDCAGSLCSECGHCMHSSDACDHECDPSGGGCQEALVTLPRMHLRVIADCEVKRGIVEDHRLIALPEHHRQHVTQAVVADRCGRCWAGPGFEAYPCPTLRAVALPYADHPEFDESWRG